VKDFRAEIHAVEDALRALRILKIGLKGGSESWDVVEQPSPESDRRFLDLCHINNNNFSSGALNKLPQATVNLSRQKWFV
jgi:hypothetical protein